MDSRVELSSVVTETVMGIVEDRCDSSRPVSLVVSDERVEVPVGSPETEDCDVLMVESIVST
jgi:hypothetical protein